MRIIEVSGPPLLYHGTSIWNLLHILSEDVLRDDLGADEFHAGVSLTSAFWSAAKFAAQAEEFTQFREGFDPPDWQVAGAVMEFSRSRLENFGLTAVEWDNVRAERELRTTGPVAGVRSLLVGLYLADRDLAHYADLAEEWDFPSHLTAMLEQVRQSRWRKKRRGFPKEMAI